MISIHMNEKLLMNFYVRTKTVPQLLISCVHQLIQWFQWNHTCAWKQGYA